MLCTLDEIRQLLSITDDTDTEVDAMLTLLAEGVSQAIEKTTNRQFEREDDATHSFRVSGRYVDFKHWDLRSVTSISVDGRELGADDYRLCPDSPPDGVYLWIELGPGLVSYNHWGDVTVEIHGDWGFASVPPVVRNVCALATVGQYRRDAAGYGTTMQLDSGLVEKYDPIPRALIGLLDSYVRPAGFGR